MFRRIIGSSLNYRFLVLGFAAALTAYGVTGFQKMPVDVFPEFTPPTVVVQTEALGLSAHEMDRMVTFNMEELLAGVPWLQSITSQSVTGLSSIVMTFEPGTDIMRARQMVQERLTNAYMLPNVARPPTMLQPLSATSRVMIISLSSDAVPLMDLSLLARWTVKPKLAGVPGVANVAVWGSRPRQLHVQIDTDRLREFQLAQEDIFVATGDSFWFTPLSFLKASAPGAGGWLDGPNQRLGIQNIQPIKGPEDLARVPLKVGRGQNLALGDVAEVVDDHAPLIGDALVNDKPGLVLVIEKFPAANTLEVTRALEAALEELKLGLPGIQVDSRVYRPASFIETAIENHRTAILIGAVLAVIALFALLAEWRVALISAVAIPVSILVAGAVLYLTKATLNTMIVAGFVVALAALVDDAIVYVENILQRLRQEREKASGKSTATVILEASGEMRGAIVYATLIVLLAVTPIFSMGGLSGAFFKPLVVSYALALLASMLVAVTLTPALCLLLLGKSASVRRESSLVLSLRRAYEAIVSRIVQAPRAAFATAAVVAAIGLALTPMLGQSLLPEFKERDLLLHWVTGPGTSQPEMTRITQQVGRELRQIPGVSKVTAHMGRAITGDQVVGINSSQIWVGIDPKANYERTVAAVKATAEGYPGVSGNVQTYLRETINKVLSGSRESIVVRVAGAEREVLLQKAEEVRQALSKVSGLVDLHVDGGLEEPIAEIQVDLAKALIAGVKPGDVRRAAATVFSGLEVGFHYDEQKIYEVVVWGAPEKRNSLANLREVQVEKPRPAAGGARSYVRLGDVADVRLVPAPTVINHEGITNYIDVVANVNGRSLGSAARDIEHRLQEVKFPLEYHAVVLGEYAEQQSARNRIVGIAIAAAIGIFLLMQAAFGSWRLAAVGFVALPAALVGGVLAAFAAGGILSLGSLVGFLAVLGLAARNGILLINHYQRLEREGGAFGPGLVLRGARERFAPTLATAAVTFLALLPLVSFGAAPGFEIEQPMAVVILGGLVTSTLLTLFVVPALYLFFGRGTAQPEEDVMAPTLAANPS